MSEGKAARRRTETIHVEELARVEGEGGLLVRVRDGRVTAVRLDIFEPPRLFEGFLRGRHASEAPDLTARICGICPVAYQMSACNALEDAFGVAVPEPLRRLRRLLYCGEWIGSHALHIHLLHAPDFLGYDSAIHMSADHGEALARGLELKKTGNAVVELLGGRPVHPVNVRLGGFYRLPGRAELHSLLDPLERGRDASLEVVRWVAGFDFPQLVVDVPLLALAHPGEYPLERGRLASTTGLDLPVQAFGEHVREIQVEHSNALHAELDGAPYLVGPLARFALNFARLSPLAREAAQEAGIGPDCRNPFRSIVVRAVEMLWAFDEALRLIREHEESEAPAVEVVPRAGVGHGCTEAPRGLLYHRYRIDDEGLIRDARIVPPTSQNQLAIERDLRHLVESRADLPRERLEWLCEQTVRNYDPCISCATHALRVRIETEG